MKYFVFILLSIVLYSCQEKTNAADEKLAAAKKAYEINLASLKKGIAAFENENIEEWAATVSDTTIWNSAAYGSSPAGKEDWKKNLMSFMADWDSIKLNYPDFLPGIDSATHEFDGSVRYYGFWNGVHRSGIRTSVNFYATYDFNREGKIVNASEFFDYGGMMNRIKEQSQLNNKLQMINNK